MRFICSVCAKEKDESEFSLLRNSTRGRQYRCKICERVIKNKYYQENRSRELERYRRYRIFNRDKWRLSLLKNQLKKYNISLDDYYELLRLQGGKCAICGRGPTSSKNRLSIDHSHLTGNVRGLLCSLCNAIIGMAGDNGEILLQAINYLGVEK